MARIRPAADQRERSNDLERSRLFLSIKELGVLDAIAVCEERRHEYTIIDGHRRYQIADRLQLKTVPCHVYPRITPGERERLRFELQTNVLELTPLERSRVIARIKETMRFATSNDLAKFLYLPASNVSLSLKLLKEHMVYADLARKYHISDTYLSEFIRLHPKLRPIRDLDLDRVIEALFEKARHKVIKNAKHFRDLIPIFLRAAYHEEELCAFLTNLDMTVSELTQRVRHTGDAILYTQTLTSVASKQQDGIALSTQEEQVLRQLFELLAHAFLPAHVPARISQT